MSPTVHVSEREVGVQWDDRGPIVVLDRDGATSERFTPPAMSVPWSDDEPEEAATAAVNEALGKVKANAEKRGLAAKTIEALLDGAR